MTHAGATQSTLPGCPVPGRVQHQGGAVLRTAAGEDGARSARPVLTADYLPRDAISHALQLIGAVHDRDEQGVALLLRSGDLRALAVTLAALVPDDKTPTELLAWCDERPAPEHGTHSSFNMHKRRGEEPCEACVDGERRYQRLRNRARRASQKQAAA